MGKTNRSPSRRAVRPVGFRSYVTLLIATLAYSACCIVIFFAFTDRQMRVEATQNLSASLNQQVQHLNMLLDRRFSVLEGTASYLGRYDDLLDGNHIALMSSLCEHTDLARICLFDTEGNAVYDDGSTGNVADRDYFQQALSGQARVLSDPLESRADSQLRVILAVPVYGRDGIIRGVLGGSYDIGALNSMLFQGVYGSAGYALISTADGDIITSDGVAEKGQAITGTNLLEFYHHVTQGDDLSAKIEQDFAFHDSDVALVSTTSGRRYLAYQPLGYNDWMICYVVTLDRALQSFRFILQYELTLCCALLIGLLVMVLVLFRINHRYHDALLQRAQIDKLTGALNKQSVTEAVDEMLALHPYEQHLFLMMDVDYFKTFNDSYGHAVGDEVLRLIGQTLRSSMREGDIIGRIGGDEFVALLCNVNSKDQALLRLQKLRETLGSLEIPGTDGHTITCSMGACLAPADGTSFAELYQHADVALYHTKSNGRDGLTVYVPSMQHETPVSSRADH